ncbi:MAG: hypothetical protein JWR82_2022 [Blastococcus sp.]|nr:hypothetical protein [Blastococcus sp.]
MRWPGGRGTQLRLLGRARDLWTPADGGAAQVMAEDVLHVGAARDRTIEDIRSEPARPELGDLVGTRGGGRLRGRLAEVVPREIASGTPLALLLDDLSGATLIAGFAYRQWADEWMTAEDGSRAPGRRMEGICAGFRPGSSALDEHGAGRDIHDIKPVRPVADPADPAGWHHLEDIAEVSMRRARRIDVWLDDVDRVLRIDSMFQDSSTVPDGGRIAVHEYGVTATVDPVRGILSSVTADPRVLPYLECPTAAGGVHAMIGTPVADLRSAVLEQLKGAAGCTHLNDALRALAEVPVLARPLLGDRGRSAA